MYITEGTITVRHNDPHELVGQWGYLDQMGNGNNLTHANWFAANFKLWLLQIRGLAPAAATPERVTSLEQAQQHATQNRQMRVVTEQVVDPWEVMNVDRPEGWELVGANVQLWEEERYPFSFPYFAGVKRLVETVMFTEGYPVRRQGEPDPPVTRWWVI